MITVLNTAPVLYPITLAEAKSHLRIPTAITNDDTYIQTLIYIAIDYVEQFTARRLLTQTWKAYLNRWPDTEYIRLPFGKLASVTSVVYTDSDGDPTTMDSGDYIVDTNSEPGQVVLDYGESWPSFTEYPVNPICITYVCGWTEASAVPPAIKHAIKILVADLYENRETNIFSIPVKKLNTVNDLLWPKKVHGCYP